MTNCNRLIGFDATPLQFSQPSGVGHYTRQLLAALVDRDDGHAYVLLANRALDAQFNLRQIGYRLPSRSVWMQTALPYALARLKPDLCHYTNFIAPIASPCPSVITLYDLSLMRHRRLHTLRHFITVRPLLPIVTRRAAAIITVSHASKQELATGLKIPPDKIRVIYGAPASRYRPITDRVELDRVRAKYDLPATYVLFVGTLEPRKNLVRLVQAFARVRTAARSTQLLLVGQSGWQHAALWREIERLDVKDAVRWLGYVPDDDLPALLSLATTFVFPSIYEGFGLPVVEAMACGTPVLTSDRSSLAEIARDAALLIDPLDTDALADGLARLLTEGGLRETLRAAGLDRAARFSWQRAAAETVQVYNEVLTGR